MRRVKCVAGSKSRICHGLLFPLPAPLLGVSTSIGILAARLKSQSYTSPSHPTSIWFRHMRWSKVAGLNASRSNCLYRSYLALLAQRRQEPAHGHVGDRKQAIELYPEVIEQLPAVVAFQFSLGRRQKIALGVEHQIQHVLRVRSKTRGIEQPEGSNTLFKHPLAANTVHLFLQIAGQGGDQLYPACL